MPLTLNIDTYADHEDQGTDDTEIGAGRGGDDFEGADGQDDTEVGALLDRLRLTRWVTAVKANPRAAALRGTMPPPPARALVKAARSGDEDAANKVKTVLAVAQGDPDSETTQWAAMAAENLAKAAVLDNEGIEEDDYYSDDEISGMTDWYLHGLAKKGAPVTVGFWPWVAAGLGVLLAFVLLKPKTASAAETAKMLPSTGVPPGLLPKTPTAAASPGANDAALVSKWLGHRVSEIPPDDQLRLQVISGTTVNGASGATAADEGKPLLVAMPQDLKTFTHPWDGLWAFKDGKFNVGVGGGQYDQFAGIPQQWGNPSSIVQTAAMTRHHGASLFDKALSAIGPQDIANAASLAVLV